MILTLTFLQLLCNEFLVVIMPIYNNYSDLFGTIFETVFAVQVCFGGIIWFAISKMLNKKFSKKKSFYVPLIFIGICFVSAFIHITIPFVSSVDAGKLAIGIKRTFFGVLLPLCQLIIYLLCYGIQWLISKLPRKPKEKNKKKNLISFYVAKVFLEHSYLLLIIISYINKLINQKYPNVNFSDFFLVAFFGVYVLEITIGGLIWYLIYRYAIKHNILTKEKAFVLPIVFMAISVIIGFLLPPGEEFKYLINVLAIFPQICQFVVYLLSFLVADIILILKHHIAKRKSIQ